MWSLLGGYASLLVAPPPGVRELKCVSRKGNNAESPPASRGRELKSYGKLYRDQRRESRLRGVRELKFGASKRRYPLWSYLSRGA